jgi:hypothetical protein
MGRATWLVVGLSLAALTAQQLRAQEVVVEIADGSVLPGTLPAGSELILVENGAQTRIFVRDVRHLAVSTFREAEAAALEAQIAGLRDRLCHDDLAVREAATRTLLALPGAAAPFLTRLEQDNDPEVALRAQAALKALADRNELFDGRDLVVLEKRVARGWLKLERFELVTGFGRLTIERGELRSLRGASVQEELADVLGGELPPPMAHSPAKLPLQVVVALQGGARLVGLVPADALALTDEHGKRLCSDGLQSLTRDRAASALFEVKRGGTPAFRADLAAKELVITGGGARQWKIATSAIDSLTVGAPGVGGSLAELVRQLEQGGAPSAQRFWVHINDQPANPWDSEQGMGMTWSLHKVVGKAALVGADASTNAYRGDTTLDQSLPLLCVKKRDLPCPGGVEADFYHGWTGYELRLSRPVAGTELTSLEAANALIQAEFGDGWELGEFHSPQGGWSWWGYWAEPDAEGR